MSEDRHAGKGNHPGANACPECGAVLRTGETCAERFERCLAREFEDWAGLGAVHHLSVTAYLLQHPSCIGREGWLEAHRRLADFLIAGKSPAGVRRENRARLNSRRRPWRMKQVEPVALPPGAAWTKTIADVRLEDASAYCADVIEWARAVLSDTLSWPPRA